MTVTPLADVVNNGNIALAQPVSVTFYADVTLLDPIGTVVVNGTPGCARRRQVAEVEWRNLVPGVHRFWVKVDSDDELNESSELDNVLPGIVVANGSRTLCPSCCVAIRLLRG